MAGEEMLEAEVGGEMAGGSGQAVVDSRVPCTVSDERLRLVTPCCSVSTSKRQRSQLAEAI